VFQTKGQLLNQIRLFRTFGVEGEVHL
jgi:hypothetical protein